MKQKKKICEVCGKREAKIKVTAVIGNKRKDTWVCEKCELVIGIKEQFAGRPREQFTPQKDLVCPECLMSLTEFKRSMRLGCPKCYEVFGEELKGIALKFHGVTSHSVRKNLKLALSEFGIKELRRRLEEAIKKEDFELAAKLRDEIRRMQRDDRGAV